MLEVSHLLCERSQQILFSNLTFKLDSGTLLRVTGPNGSGKSTLLKILAGLLPATAGNISWQNKSILNTDVSYHSEILYIGHKLGLLSTLTPLENLKWLLGLSSSLSSAVSSKPVMHSIRLVLEKLGLQNYFDVPCNRLSSGQQQRVALARLWLQSAKIWILDEPYTALDLNGQNLVKSQISQHIFQGGIVIMTDHHHQSEGCANPNNETTVCLGQGEQI